MTTLLHDIRSADWAARAAASPAVVLLLHGYGSHELDLVALAPALRTTMPWASLRAPLPLGNGGAAWFAITTPGDPDEGPVALATDAVWAWVDATLGAEARVVPIGFSQGGLMAGQLLRTRPERVLAPVILGGFVQAASQPGDAVLRSTQPEVFWGRGADDRVITEAAVARTGSFLTAHATLNEKVYRGLGHAISAAEINDVRAFLADELGEGAIEP